MTDPQVTPASYREAYARLSRIAAELESGEADLDRVLPLLEEARTAYAQCRERIEAVRSVLAGDWASGDWASEDQGEDPDEEDDEPGDPSGGT
ncbi:exodeoxyribonuclease VII small subunit [Deinococcus taeanensis]|uniref:exodeoxyribonuclease VII small subunit n=1 Tax=Deinococcus taeanensis TaxID=2737050 RepID=UPI001CDBFD87|nr:exodeoxyribonuclease VII small subunit [Deinococcus taeanensis]UBV42940.1 exodeoxyribonuclease VII small subunit [Deinococcus taeanensis]